MSERRQNEEVWDKDVAWREIKIKGVRNEYVEGHH